jgi:hypothetical protein
VGTVRLDKTGRFQLGVGTGNGAGCNPQVPSQLPDRRESLPTPKNAGPDLVAQLTPDLLEHGDSARLVDGDHQRSWAIDGAAE